jgi:hypothetical protein
MGIRNHKAIGYGLFYEGVHTLLERLDESAVKGEVDSLIREHLSTHERIRGVDDNLFLETAKMAEKYGKTEYPETFLYCIKSTVYDEDDGYLLIIPPIYIDQWSRYDDIIDYCEIAFKEDEEFVTKIQELNHPIYPYSTWVNPETFIPIPADEYYTEAKYKEPKPIPGIPTSVKLIATKIGIDWKKLKPMIATWWG